MSEKKRRDRNSRISKTATNRLSGRRGGRRDRNTSELSDTESKLEDRGEKVFSSEYVKKRNLKNDPNWYFTDPILADQVSQLSFQQFLGSDYSKLGDYTVPTTMVLYMNPSPMNTFTGISPTVLAPETTGINLACRALFNELSMNSGRNMAYQPCDLGIMILALGELYSMVSYVKRAFGVIQTFNPRNRMFPVKVVQMMGFDADDFLANVADYRMRFNTLLAAVNQLPMLTNCGYLQKCAEMYDAIYLDQNSPMAQIYLPVPATTWIIDETASQMGTVLKTTDVVQTLNDMGTPKRWTFRQFMHDVLEPMVYALMDSSTLNLIYADLLNLAGKKNLSFMTFSPVTEEYAVMPIHNQGFLEQLHNATTVGQANYPSYDATLNVTPNNDVYCDASSNSLIYNPGFQFAAVSGGMYTASNPIFDCMDGNPDKVRRIEMTRMTSCFTNNNFTVGGVNYNHFVELPDHYLGFMHIFANDPDNEIATIYTLTDNTSYPTIDDMIALEKFDWAPIIRRIDSTDITANNVQRVFGDVNFFTETNILYLERVNACVSMGLFKIR